MKEILIGHNESGQRLDRFIRKLLGEASLSFIYKQIRKKNIVVNDLKVSEKYLLKEGDKVKIFFSDDTLDSLRTKKKQIKNKVDLDIVYEDHNVILINKPAGLLSHSTKNDYKEKNVVDAMLTYLYNKGEYDPKDHSTFTPSLANRLDRNTSGLLLGAKTYNAIQELNKAQRDGKIKKLYYTLVVGNISSAAREVASIEKLEGKLNHSKVSKDSLEDKKNIITAYRPIKRDKNYSLLEVDLITGRTHQIRAHLSFLDMPLVGDSKYGRKKTNIYFKEKYGLNHQLLHCHKISFLDLGGDLEYLSNKDFEVGMSTQMQKITKGELE